MEIKNTPDHLWAAVQYFGGLYSQLTGKNMAFFEVQTEHLEFYHDSIISIPETIINVKYNAPSAYNLKIAAKFILLEKFINNNCVFHDNYEILNKNLLKSFEEYIQDKVESKHEFPDLMKLILEKYPNDVIKVKKNNNGVIYEGIKLKPKNYTLSQINIPKSTLTQNLPLSTVVQNSPLLIPIQNSPLSITLHNNNNNNNYITIPEIIESVPIENINNIKDNITILSRNN